MLSRRLNALELQPTYAVAFNNLGVTLMDVAFQGGKLGGAVGRRGGDALVQGRTVTGVLGATSDAALLEAALSAFDGALANDPSHTNALRNRAVVLTWQVVLWALWASVVVPACRDALLLFDD